jgi:hypothetical protein
MESADVNRRSQHSNSRTRASRVSSSTLDPISASVAGSAIAFSTIACHPGLPLSGEAPGRLKNSDLSRG